MEDYLIERETMGCMQIVDPAPMLVCIVAAFIVGTLVGMVATMVLWIGV